LQSSERKEKEKQVLVKDMTPSEENERLKRKKKKIDGKGKLSWG